MNETPLDIVHDDEKFRLWVCVKLTGIEAKLEGVDSMKSEVKKLKARVAYLSAILSVLVSALVHYIPTWLK